MRAVKNSNRLAVPGLFVVLVIFPLLIPNPAVTTIGVFALIFAGAATGWNLFSGYTGYISLGYTAFYGLGAYILAILCQVWHIPGGFSPFLLLPVVGLATALCSLAPGWIALKTRRYTFMVIAIAIYTLIAQLPDLLSGNFPGLSEITLPIPYGAGISSISPFIMLRLLCFSSLSVFHGGYVNRNTG